MKKMASHSSPMDVQKTPVKYAGPKFHTASPSPQALPIPVFTDGCNSTSLPNFSPLRERDEAEKKAASALSSPISNRANPFLTESATMPNPTLSTRPQKRDNRRKSSANPPPPPPSSSSSSLPSTQPKPRRKSKSPVPFSGMKMQSGHSPLEQTRSSQSTIKQDSLTEISVNLKQMLKISCPM